MVTLARLKAASSQLFFLNTEFLKDFYKILYKIFLLQVNSVVLDVVFDPS